MAVAGTVWAPTVNALYCFDDQRSYARPVLTDERFANLLEEAEREQWTQMAQAPDPIVMPQTAFLVENTESYVDSVARNTRSAQAAGIPVALGTDGGPAGISTQLELELLVTAGLTPSEALAAATLGGALALGTEADVGRIEVGKLADLLVLRADPTIDVRSCREIEWVIQGGVAHAPGDLALTAR